MWGGRGGEGREGRGGGGGVDRHSTWKLLFLMWGGRGGRGGREGGGGGRIDTQLGKLSVGIYMGDPGRIDRDPGEGGEGRSTLNFEKWSCHLLRWGSGRGGRGGRGGEEGGRSTLNLESEVGITLWIRGGSTLILGGGSIDTQLGKLSFLRWAGRGGREGGEGGGRSTLNLERICKSLEGLPCGSGVDRHWSWGGSIETHFEKWSWDLQCGSGKDLTMILGEVDRHSTWKVKLGLPCGSGVDRHWSRGKSIDTELGKDLQWLWKDRLYLERIRKILGGIGGTLKVKSGITLDRIASMGSGSTLTLEGSPEVGKDLHCGSLGGSTLILGGVNDTHFGKSEVCQMLIMGGSGALWKSTVGITLQIRGQSTLTLKSEVEIYIADPGLIDTDPGGGSIDTQLWKWSWDLHCGSGSDRHWSWGGSIDTHFEKWSWDLHCRSRVDRHWSWGGVDRHSLWKVKLRFTLQIWGGSTLILGGVDRHSLWKVKLRFTLQIRGRLTLILGGGLIDTHFEKWSWDLHCGSGVDRHWSWGGGVGWHSLWKVKFRFTLRIQGGSTLILGGGGWGRSTLNLERICNDFGRITSATADPGGRHLSAPDIPCAARVAH